MKLDWARDGASWPHHERSRFVSADGLLWHVQWFDGPSAATSQIPATPALLLHGTGASSHSWRSLAPLLAAHRSVMVVDLPGHGFTALPTGRSASMPAMAQGVSALLAAMNVRPGWIVGHSAGAAIAAWMSLQALGPFAEQESLASSNSKAANTKAAAGSQALPAIGSINGALLPLHGVVFQFFSPAAKLLSAAPGIPQWVAWRARNVHLVDRLLAGTGSKLDAQGKALYARLMQSPGHVNGALRMMADWDLPTLERALPRLCSPLHLVVGEQDATLSPGLARRVQAIVPHATLSSLPSQGHLAHEEAPEATLRALFSGMAER